MLRTAVHRQCFITGFTPECVQKVVSTVMAMSHLSDSPPSDQGRRRGAALCGRSWVPGVCVISYLWFLLCRLNCLMGIFESSLNDGYAEILWNCAGITQLFAFQIKCHGSWLINNNINNSPHRRLMMMLLVKLIQWEAVNYFMFELRPWRMQWWWC